ncbi:MAG TPA: hypothetical protein VK699_19435 [Terriglobales bacterium]|jgi:hypothetical protein|nr:hypothetical protein [Terriglobales bacterium]
MRRTSFFPGLAILAVTVSIANAQGRGWGGDHHGDVVFNGIPASATSITPNNLAPGIPPSATSITVPPNIRFNNFNFNNRPIFRANGSDRDFHRHHRVVAVPVGVPVYYPYYYPPSDAVDYGDQEQPQASEQPAEPEAPAPTAFENRPGYQLPPVKAYQPAYQPSVAPPAQNDNSTAPSQPAASQADDNAPSEPEPTTILVFRDGHQLEIGNYAIVGDTLYNLAGNYKTHKILLADLDLDKTAKVNEDRGYEFRLPQQGN